MEKRLKTNPLQWAIFLDFAEAKPVILTRKFDSVNGKQKYEELWKEIAATLNSMGFLQKTVSKWQKAVADWKSKVKGKAADINKGLTKTGGGGPLPPLNDNEQRLMSIIGWSVTGTNTVELGFDAEMTGIPEGSLEESAISSASVEVTCCDVSDIVSPPPLFYPTANCSNVNTTIESIKPVSLNTASTPSKSVPNRKVLSATRKTSGSTPLSRFKENVATKSMQQMHTETMGVLKEINCNLGRMADTQEKLCNLLEKLNTKNEGT